MRNIDDLFQETPEFHVAVYKKIPDFLTKITEQFERPKEKDIILLSSIVILSGCFSSLRGKYGKEWIHPNLYCFIIAPAVSNKGIMKFSSILGKQIHDRLVNTHQAAKSEYQVQHRKWERASRVANDLPEPQHPKLPVLFIPGNSSAAAIYSRLADSNSTGIIFETEADTVTNTLKQDWANFSDLYRKGFHHEPITSDRVKNNRELINIERPRLSILLSGTPGQVPKLIASSEDGLMSRFIFYCFSNPLEWISQKPDKDAIDLADLFRQLGSQVLEIRDILERDDYVFELPDEQFDKADAFFIKKVDEIKDEKEKAKIIYRLGLISFRICMVLTVLRNIDILKTNQVLRCDIKDFTAAMWMIDALLKHSKLMFDLLPNESNLVSPIIKDFFSKLPINIKFSSESAQNIGVDMGIADRTVRGYIQKLKEKNMIEDAGYGYYIIKKGDAR